MKMGHGSSVFRNHNKRFEINKNMGYKCAISSFKIWRKQRTYIEFKEVSFTEYLLMLKNICSLLEFKGRPLLRRVKGGFEKLNFKLAFSKEKENDLVLFMEVLAKGDFVKLGPLICFMNANMLQVYR